MRSRWHVFAASSRTCKAARNTHTTPCASNTLASRTHTPRARRTHTRARAHAQQFVQWPSAGRLSLSELGRARQTAHCCPQTYLFWLESGCMPKSTAFLRCILSYSAQKWQLGFPTRIFAVYQAFHVTYQLKMSSINLQLANQSLSWILNPLLWLVG